MSNWNDYKPEVSSNATTGKHRCIVVDAEETISKSSGKPMFVITVTPNGSKAKVKKLYRKKRVF